MLVPWSCNDAGRALAATAVAAASLRMTKQLLELRKCLKQIIQLLGSKNHHGKNCDSLNYEFTM